MGVLRLARLFAGGVEVVSQRAFSELPTAHVASLDPTLLAASALAATESESLDLVGTLSAVQATAFRWDISRGLIDWETNAGAVLGIADAAEISLAADYHKHLAPGHALRRTEAVDAPAAGGNAGTPYRIQYRFHAAGPCATAPVWIEEQGRFWSDTHGRPSQARGVIRVVGDDFHEEQRRLYSSDLDELTGQLNRLRLTEALGKCLERTVANRQSCAFLIVGVNNLAVINETFGFDVGDQVIADVAERIATRLRGGDILGRYSSNKFGVVLNECGPGAMRIAAERIMSVVRDTRVTTTSCPIAVTLSIGGVIAPNQAHTVQQSVNFALQAFDRAKSDRTGSFVIYEPMTGRESTRRKSIIIADEVVSALDEDRMRLVLQPMIGATSSAPELYECLLRMERHDGTLVSAGEFVQTAERLGLSRLIDRRTLELTIRLLQRHSKIRLSLNVSSLTCADREWLAALQRLTHGRPDILKRMVVEITETTAIQDLDQSIHFVDTLKELGCAVAIDDFGAGYTSFKNLKLLDVNMIKIDGMFVKNVADDTSDQIFVKTMIELARVFDIETVAEWVEDERAAEFLRQSGITYLQGFHYGMPMDPSLLPA